MATAGCRHKPFKAIILIPSAENEIPSVYAEHGGTLEFRMDEGVPENSTFEVQFLQQVCDPNDKLSGTNTQPVTCHITGEGGDYDVTILETIGGTQNHPPRTVTKEIKAYVRPCTGCKP